MPTALPVCGDGVIIILGCVCVCACECVREGASLRGCIIQTHKKPCVVRSKGYTDRKTLSHIIKTRSKQHKPMNPNPNTAAPRTSSPTARH